MSLLLGLVTLGFLGLLLAGKILTVLELRSLDHEFRQKQNRIAELERDLETSRRKYLIALKAEGIAKHRVSQLKAQFTGLKQNLEQIELKKIEQQARKDRDLEQKLEALVMVALGGTSVRRDSHFKRVIAVIKKLIDLEKQSSSEELLAAIQEKLAEMGQTGFDEAADRAASKGAVDSDDSDAEMGQAGFGEAEAQAASNGAADGDDSDNVPARTDPQPMV